ncbi:hypothetical protein BSA16_28700, partial [Micromonospora sp. Rc5]
MPGFGQRHRVRHAVEERQQHGVGEPVQPQQRHRPAAGAGLDGQAGPAGDHGRAQQKSGALLWQGDGVGAGVGTVRPAGDVRQ